MHSGSGARGSDREGDAAAKTPLLKRSPALHAHRARLVNACTTLVQIQSKSSSLAAAAKRPLSAVLHLPPPNGWNAGGPPAPPTSTPLWWQAVFSPQEKSRVPLAHRTPRRRGNRGKLSTVPKAADFGRPAFAIIDVDAHSLATVHVGGTVSLAGRSTDMFSVASAATALAPIVYQGGCSSPPSPVELSASEASATEAHQVGLCLRSSIESLKDEEARQLQCALEDSLKQYAQTSSSSRSPLHSEVEFAQRHVQSTC